MQEKLVHELFFKNMHRTKSHNTVVLVPQRHLVCDLCWHLQQIAKVVHFDCSGGNAPGSYLSCTAFRCKLALKLGTHELNVGRGWLVPKNWCVC